MSQALARVAKESMGYEACPELEVCSECRHSEQRASRKLWCIHPDAPAAFRVKWTGTCGRWDSKRGGFM